MAATLLVTLPEALFSQQDPALDRDLLTPVGAERAGNLQGSIPAWTGGIQQPPAGYEPGDHHPDPFAADQVLFTITAANMQEHADKLSAGQQALLQAYPDSWSMPIYPSHRSAAYPEHVYEALRHNAEHAQLDTSGAGAVSGSRLTSPFPRPSLGVEVIWNHNLRWRGVHARHINGTAAVTRRGNYTRLLIEEDWSIPYASRHWAESNDRSPHLLLAYKRKVLAPGSLAGAALLAIEYTDHNAMPRQSWIYSPDLRRVLRAPFAGFDNPAPQSDGLRFNDEVDGFNGSPALFNWSLLGKREMYIPYNNYRLHSNELTHEDILKQRHINPEHTRYELHRVWVVEGIVREKSRNMRALRLEERGHSYARRVLYVDEDSWQVVLADNYDHEGRLWRFTEGHSINYYEVPVPWYTLAVYYDLLSRRYLVTGLDNQQRPFTFDEDINPRLFGPAGLDFYVR